MIRARPLALPFALPGPLRAEAHLAAIWISAALLFAFGPSWLAHLDNAAFAAFLFVWLVGAILWGAFAVVRHAEAIAHRLGEPYGTLVLTLAVTGIEVAFIVAATFDPGGGVTLARDAVFSVLMITLNGMAGLYLLLGGLRYGEQEHNLQGTRSFLAVIVPVAAIALILPNFTTSAPGPKLSPAQCAIFGALILLLYCVFLVIQTMRHREFFRQPRAARTRTPRLRAAPERGGVLMHGTLLLLTLLPVIYLTKPLAAVTAHAIATAEAPAPLAGLLIAVLVLCPEGISALNAAWRNELQRAFNTSLGSALATVGLTIPAVLAIGAWTREGATLGLEAEEMVLLAITFLVAVFTFAAQRTNLLVGLVHLVLFAVFVTLIFNP